jgi:uncharacterized membrane protein
MNGKSTQKRTIAKSVTYRVGCIIATILMAYFITHDWAIATGFGLLIEGIHAVWYYIHERLWNRTDWGRVF